MTHESMQKQDLIIVVATQGGAHFELVCIELLLVIIFIMIHI